MFPVRVLSAMNGDNFEQEKRIIITKVPTANFYDVTNLIKCLRVVKKDDNSVVYKQRSDFLAGAPHSPLSMMMSFGRNRKANLDTNYHGMSRVIRGVVVFRQLPLSLPVVSSFPGDFRCLVTPRLPSETSSQETQHDDSFSFHFLCILMSF